MTESDEEICPICSGRLESGCVMGTFGYAGSFRWFEGKPSMLKNVFGAFSVESEELASFELFKGPYMLGSRCTKCRKLFLNY